MNIKEKLGLLFAATILMTIFILPVSFLEKFPDFPFKQYLIAQNYHLGLDLKGGTHLNYKVDLSNAQRYNLDDDKTNDVVIPELVEGVRATLEKRVNGLGVSEPNIYISKMDEEYRIIVELAGVTDIEKAKDIVGKTIQLEFKELIDDDSDETLKEKELIKKQSEQIFAKAKIAKDFKVYGESIVSSDGKIEFSTQSKTQDELVSEIKGIWDLEQGKVYDAMPEIVSGTIYIDSLAIPKTGYSIIKVLGKEGGKINYEQIFISTVISKWKTTGLDGSHFKRAQVVFNQAQAPLVSIEFDTEGAKLFGEITGKNVGRPLAIFVGGNLISSPMVNEEILGGVAQITGNFTLKEAVLLKTDLNTGAIGAPVVLSGQHQVEASLGEKSLNLSINASLWGLLALLLYMIYKYRILGVVAAVALLVYSIILLFILKNSGAMGVSIVLTLAGVSGIILSIGMAVDANILIFERMKEEIKDGKNLMSAVSIGFDRAWSSIRDSNFSSLITCGILIWFGTSMIRGFAINLSLGILISMFTAITFTKTVLLVLLPMLPAKYRKYLG